MRAFGILFASVFASLLAVVSAFGTAPQAEGASGVRVCGSGYGHGVGLSQYGAKGRAEAGQGHEQIIRAYYDGASLQKSSSPAVRVLLAEKASDGYHDVTVREGREGRMKNLASGGTVDLAPGRYRAKHLPDRNLYRVTDLSQNERVGVYTGPLVFQPAGGGPLGTGDSDYRGTFLVQNAGARLQLVNRLGMEGYIRGVVPEEMPPSWASAALESQAIAARSYAEATRRPGNFDFYADTRDQVYGGVSVETAATNRATAATFRKLALHDGEPIIAFFHAASGGYTESSANVFGGARPYLKATRDADGSGGAYEGGAYAGSPWMRWSGTLDPDGSPRLGVGSIQEVQVLDRSPSGRVQEIRIKGSEGEKTVSGQQEIRFGLKSSGISRNDGSSFPGGVLPSARVSFGSACG